MHFVKSPSSVTPSFVVENLEGGAESSVVCIAQLSDKIQNNKAVVVVMNRVVEPEPGTVPFLSIVEKLSSEIKLDSSLDSAVDASGPSLLWQHSVRSESFPAVKSSLVTREADPATVF